MEDVFWEADMESKRSIQAVISTAAMITFTVGGLFCPYLGLGTAAVAAFLVFQSIFNGRKGCTKFCPRGIFISVFMPFISLNKKIPKFMLGKKAKYIVLAVFISLLSFKLFNAGWNLAQIGSVMISMCITSTVIAVILGVLFKPKSWCTVCPLGTIQTMTFNTSQKVSAGGYVPAFAVSATAIAIFFFVLFTGVIIPETETQTNSEQKLENISCKNIEGKRYRHRFRFNSNRQEPFSQPCKSLNLDKNPGY
jgi:hypothetical protein